MTSLVALTISISAFVLVVRLARRTLARLRCTDRALYEEKRRRETDPEARERYAGIVEKLRGDGDVVAFLLGLPEDE